MIKMKKVTPFINIGPGYSIKKYLDARGWSQDDLAQLMDISAKQLSQIINDKARITIETARLLAKAFDTSPDFWINLDTRYRLNLTPDTLKEASTKIKAQIRKYMPVTDIIKKGWFENNTTVEGYKELYESIWNTKYNDTLIYSKSNQLFCARQKKDNEEFTQYYSLTWLQIARIKAKEINVPSYNEDKLQSIIDNYTNFTYTQNGIQDFIMCLNEAGIKFFVLSHLSKTYLDGACFYDDKNPVIVYTGRYDRIDNFWFTVAHEIAHVVLHLPRLKIKSFLDDLKDGESINQQEKEADRKAEEILRVGAIVESARPYAKYFSEDKLISIAEKLQIERSVILGVLQYKNLVDYRKLNKYKKPVIEIIPKRLVFG